MTYARPWETFKLCGLSLTYTRPRETFKLCGLSRTTNPLQRIAWKKDLWICFVHEFYLLFIHCILDRSYTQTRLTTCVLWVVWVILEWACQKQEWKGIGLISLQDIICTVCSFLPSCLYPNCWMWGNCSADIAFALLFQRVGENQGFFSCLICN